MHGGTHAARINRPKTKYFCRLIARGSVGLKREIFEYSLRIRSTQESKAINLHQICHFGSQLQLLKKIFGVLS